MPNKIQFNQKINFVLRRLIHFRPHGIRWRSNIPDGSCRQLSPKIFTSKTFWGSPYWRHPSGDFKTHIKRLGFISRAGFTSSVALFIISLLIIFPVYYKTQLAEAAGSLSDTTLSITSDNLTAGVDLLVTSDSGTFASSTSPMSFSVNTNNVTGYMLSISAKTGTDLTNSTAGTSFTSIDATNSTVAAGITADVFGNAGNTIYNNMWGFKPNYYKSTANSDKFYPSPTTNGVTLNKTSSANAANSLDTYTIAIGARATYSQPAGTYNNAYILNAVGNYPKYSFTYIDSLTGNTISTDISAGASTTATLASAPSKDNYEFKGWCTVNNSSDPSQCKNASGTAGTTYAAGSSFSLSTLSANALNFYTIWERSLPDLAIQNLDATECTTTPTEVYDTRDNTIYDIQRLADGNCWLLDNLALDLTDANVQSRLNSSTTNATNTDINYLLNGGGTTSDQYATAGVSNNWNGSYSYSAPLIATSGDCADANCANVPSTGKWTSTATVNWAVGIESIDGATGGRIGAYYNYCAASAGTYCYGDGTSSGISSGNALADICPSGWRMPLGGSAGEYQSLYTAYGSDVIKFITAFHAALPGIYYNGYANIQNSDGYYWSSTRSSNDRMSGLNVTARASSFLPSNGLIRFGGLPVRCVMRNSSEYLQNVTQESMAAKMPNVGDTATLYDIRDNNAYTVGRLADGNYWLLDNLRLGGDSPIELTSADTNIASGATFTLPASTATGFINGNDDPHASFANPEINTDSVNTTEDYGAVKGMKYGGYYNYCATSAGTYCYEHNSAPEGVNAEYDICPASWRLPSNIEYRTLYTQYSGYADFRTAFRFPVPGFWQDDKLNHAGIWGFYWTSTRTGASWMGDLDVTQAEAYAYQRDRFRGNVIRCMLKSEAETELGIKYMQDFNSSNKSTIMAKMEENKQYQLIDNRDNKKYYLAKLETDAAAPGGVVEENGKYYQVWMTQNLDLCIGCSASANGTGVATAALTNLNTDINPSSTQSIYSTSDSSTGYSTSNGVTTWTPASTAITTNATISGTTVAGWSKSSTAPYSAEGGNYYVITSNSYDADSVSDNCTSGATICPHYHRGNYYNYQAAIATNNRDIFSTHYTKADNSICPAGWMLPYGIPYASGNSDFDYLLVKHGITAELAGEDAWSTWRDDGLIKLRNSPFYITRSGHIDNGLTRSGIGGTYWSGTVYNSSNAYNFWFMATTSAIGGPAGGGNFYYGWSIRCLVR